MNWHTYLYHPPFKRFSPVSAVCEASSLLMMLKLVSCPTSQSPFCRQYLSETRNFKVQIFLFTFTKSEIKSSLQSHVHLSVHHNDLLWNSLTLRSTFTMTPIYLRLQKVKTRSTFQKSSSQFQNNPNHLFLKRKSILSIWQIEDFSRRFPTWILHCRLNAFYALPILIQTF